MYVVFSVYNSCETIFTPLPPFDAFSLYSAGDCLLSSETNTAAGGGTLVTEEILTEEQ